MMQSSTSFTSRPRLPPSQREKAASSSAAVRLRFWRAIGSLSASVLLEFPDLEAAKRFYESPEYQAAKRLREGAADFNMVAVQGVA